MNLVFNYRKGNPATRPYICGTMTGRVISPLFNPYPFKVFHPVSLVSSSSFFALVLGFSHPILVPATPRQIPLPHTTVENLHIRYRLAPRYCVEEWFWGRRPQTHLVLLRRTGYTLGECEKRCVFTNASSCAVRYRRKNTPLVCGPSETSLITEFDTHPVRARCLSSLSATRSSGFTIMPTT